MENEQLTLIPPAFSFSNFSSLRPDFDHSNCIFDCQLLFLWCLVVLWYKKVYKFLITFLPGDLVVRLSADKSISASYTGVIPSVVILVIKKSFRTQSFSPLWFFYHVFYQFFYVLIHRFIHNTFSVDLISNAGCGYK